MYFIGDGCYLVFAIGFVVTTLDYMLNTTCHIKYNEVVSNRQEGRGRMWDYLTFGWLISVCCILGVVGGGGSSVPMLLRPSCFVVLGVPLEPKRLAGIGSTAWGNPVIEDRVCGLKL